MMRSSSKRLLYAIIRWSIPLLAALLCLCFRFSHFRWQLLVLLLCLTASWLLFCSRRRIRRDLPVIIVFVILLALLVGYFSISWGITHPRYTIHSLDRNVFRGKKILVMVPHQDDEINLFGGLYETFEDGSDVTVMFSTNGDMVVSGETRIQEAVTALAAMGISEDHIIFLGYGDSPVSRDRLHMYNLPGNLVIASPEGHTETYAAAGFEPYRNSAYTRDNMKGDIRTLLLDLRPDVIFCIDYDYHHDHRALSLLFEEAMGEILHRKENDYTPAVFKGFGYSTAYLGTKDFYTENLLSTVPWSDLYPFPGSTYTNEEGDLILYMGENNIYLWNDRLRFPLSESNLARTLYASRLFPAMAAHHSQDNLYEAQDNLSAILNGDKVFWPRHTSGLLYQAAVSVSSGDGSMLTDFKLIDSADIYDKKRMPFENLWAPSSSDSQKAAVFTFPEETRIDTIMLYDNPSLTNNITEARILFSDGSELTCGPLKVNGSPTALSFEAKVINSFTLQLLSWEGDQPGLSEVEAYNGEPRRMIPEIIKLQDSNGNFIYDYWLTDGTEVLSVYNSLDTAMETSPGKYSLHVRSGQCRIERINGQTFSISCRKGSTAELALYKEGALDKEVDLVTIRNPFFVERVWNSLLTEAEQNPNFYFFPEQKAYFRQIIMDYIEKRRSS